MKDHQYIVFEDRYQHKSGDIVEDINGMRYRNAKTMASVEIDEQYWLNEFLELMKDFKFVPGGRILSTAGTGKKHPFFNCYVIDSPHDSRHGIMDNVKKMIDIMAGGGGVGVDLSTLRPNGAKVKGVDGRSSGAVSWGNIYSEATGIVEQGGSRRGALLISLRVDHPDILEFIKAKEDFNLLTNANLSVAITNDFMEAVENDNDWELKWNGETYQTLKARYIWDEIAESAWKSGEPGLIFIDRMNEYNNTYYFEKIKTTNPCVTGDTLVLTENGYERIDKLINKEVNIWNGYEFSRVIPQITSQNEYVYHFKFSNETELKCTDYHEFYVKDNKGEAVTKIAKHLEIGDELIEYYIPTIYNGEVIAKDSINVSVISKQPWGKEDEVYCFNEPKNHTGCFNGVVTSQCGEQMLPIDGVCLLGNINLSKYVDEYGISIDFERLRKDIETAVRFLDNAIDVSNYLYEDNEKTVKQSRRIGLGTMGLADMLLKLGIRYGSSEAVEFVDNLYNFIKETAYRGSIKLAKEKGSFSMFDAEKYLEGKFVKQLSQDIRKDIFSHGIRNSTLLTIPPTGSTGMLADASTGIEPVFSWRMWREDKLGARWINHWILDKFDENNLPDYAVRAMEVPAEKHVKMQTTIQKHIDSSVSKTINMSSDATVENVKSAYIQAYKDGAKGMTVYRDKSRDKQVLYTENENKNKKQYREIKPPQKEANGTRYDVPTGCGKMWIHLYNDDKGNLIECFITGGRKGGCKSFTETSSRLLSAGLRADPPLPVDYLIEQLYDVEVCNSFRDAKKAGKDLKGYNCASAIAETIKYHLAKNNMKSSSQEVYIGNNVFEDEQDKENLCPDCGRKMIKQGGCYQCSCGYSGCD